MLSFFLQSDYQFVKEADSSQIIGFFILIVIVILLLVIGGKSSGKPTTRKRKRSGSGISYNKSSFKKAAMSLGCNKQQVRILEAMTKQLGITNPFKLLNSSTYFDQVLRRAIHMIEESNASPGEKEGQKSLIYGIRQIIERNAIKKQAAIRSTKILKFGTEVSLSDRPGYAVSTTISGNVDRYLMATTPINSRDQKIRWHKGSKIKVSFWRNESEGYHFFSRIVGYRNQNGMSNVMLEHTNNIVPTQQRRFRRKPLSQPAYVYPILIMELGRGKKHHKKAIVQDNLAVMGKMIDISAGGCAVRSSSPKKEGTLVKVSFETERGNPVVIYGKVVRTRITQLRGRIMHIKMTRISHQNLNKIRAYVYEVD